MNFDTNINLKIVYIHLVLIKNTYEYENKEEKR